MRPIELNIKENILGKGIYLYDSNIIINSKKSTYSEEIVSYFLQGFNIRLLRKYVIINIVKSIKRKFYL